MNIKTILPKVNKETFIDDYLNACGIEDIEEYLRPTGKYVDAPMNYEGMQEGLNLLCTYVNKKLDADYYIVHDSDVDGLCSATITLKFLEHLGIDGTKIHILIHEGKLHGLSPDIMAPLSKITNSLIIIPDAGTNNVEMCKLLEERNNKVLILDHHDREKLNPYATIINNQISPNVANKSLCGTGVTWKFITAYCKQYLDGDPFYMSLIDLVNFANLADVVNMCSQENRTISAWCKNIKNPFLKALCDEYIKGAITPESLVWNVVPKLNAVCRLGGDKESMDIKYGLFCAFAGVNTADWFFADTIKKINSAYRKQKQIVKELYEGIIGEREPTEHKVEVVSIGSTPYTGLVASKLMDYYNKPVLLVHEKNGVLSGSLRSPYPLKTILNESGLATCQGHKQACGVFWNVDDTEMLMEYCDSVEMPTPVVEVCCSYVPDKIPHDIFGMFDEWDYLYARGVPYPLFHIAPIRINSKNIQLIGANKTTLKFTYKGVDYIKFFVSSKEKEALFIDVLNSRRSVWLEIEVVGKLQLNEFRGNVTEQVLIDRFECREHTPELNMLW